MPETTPDNKPVNPDVRYERNEVGIRPVVVFVIGLTVLAVVVHVVLYWMHLGLEQREDRKHPPPPPLAAKERPNLPRDIDKIPQPRLEPEDTAIRLKLREQEDALLNSYGWVDPREGIVRIPVEEAMRLLADPKTAAALGVRVRGTKEEGSK